MRRAILVFSTLILVTGSVSPSAARVSDDTQNFISSDPTCSSQVAPTNPSAPTFLCRRFHVIDDSGQGDDIDISAGAPTWKNCGYRNEGETPGTGNEVDVTESTFNVYHLHAHGGGKIFWWFIWRWIKWDPVGQAQWQTICPVGFKVPPQHL